MGGGRKRENALRATDLEYIQRLIRKLPIVGTVLSRITYHTDHTDDTFIVQQSTNDSCFSKQS